METDTWRDAGMAAVGERARAAGAQHLDPEAATHWLMVYMTYFRNMASSVASHLYRSIGERAAIMQFGNIVEEAIMNSFNVQREAAKRHGLELRTIDDLFRLNHYCHHEAAQRLSALGVEVFDIKREGDKYIMETERCGLLEAARHNPPLRILPVALVSGLLRGLGVRSRWLSSPAEKHYLCRSQADRYTHVVYLDEKVQPPHCRIVVEPLRCP